MGRSKLITLLTLLIYIYLVPAIAGSASNNQGKPLCNALSMYKATGISPEQESKLVTIVQNFEEEMIVKTRMLLSLMREMRKLSLNPDPSPSIVLAKQSEINKLNAEIALERTKTMLNMRFVLTPEQREKFVQLMREKMISPANK